MSPCLVGTRSPFTDRHAKSWTPTRFPPRKDDGPEGPHHRTGASARALGWSGEVQDPGMYGRSLTGNRAMQLSESWADIRGAGVTGRCRHAQLVEVSLLHPFREHKIPWGVGGWPVLVQASRVDVISNLVL